MNVLLVNWVYNWGSTGYIVHDLKIGLTSLGHKVQIATGRNVGKEDVMVFCKPNEQKIFWRLHRLGLSRFRGSTKASRRLIEYIKKTKPDIVNLHLLHCNYLNLYHLLKWLGKNNIKTVITNHAEMYYTGSCEHAYECKNFVTIQCRNCPNKKYAVGASYIGGNPHRNWMNMKKAFSYFRRGNLLFTAVSPWMQERFYLSPITRSFKCETTLNGVETNIFQRQRNLSPIYDRLENNENYILHVTAKFNPTDNEDLKGGHHIIELAHRMPEQKFIVVATNSTNTDKLPSNIFLWGKARDQKELAQLYSGADLTVLVSRKETFSMVTAESLCCGTPVVGFKAGGPESIALPEFSNFVEYANYEDIVKSIKEFQITKFDRNRISEVAHEKYNLKAMAHQYLGAYSKILK